MNRKLYAKIFMFLFVCILLCSCTAPKENTDASLEDHPMYSYTYRTSEYLDDNTYDEYLSDDGTLFRCLMDYQKSLQSSSQLAFIPYSNNLVELVSTDIPDQCMVNYGTQFEEDSRYEYQGEPITAAEAIQITDDYFELFPLSIDQGRSFEEGDCNYLETKRIPVILGSAYRDTFRIGDAFEGYYILSRFTFEVIGIAESGSSFYKNSESRPVPYDTYIIMPAAKITEDSKISRMILLQQTCGYTIAENGRDHAVSMIEEYLRDAGLGSWVSMISTTEKSLQDVLHGRH